LINKFSQTQQHFLRKINCYQCATGKNILLRNRYPWLMVIFITDKLFNRQRKIFIKLFTFYIHIRVFISMNRTVGDRHGPIKIFILLFVRN